MGGMLHPRWLPFLLSLPDWLYLRIAKAALTVDETARSSMWDDLQRGRQTEIEFLNGEIIQLGRLHGVKTPINKGIYRLIKDAEEAKSPPSYSADELHDLLLGNRKDSGMPLWLILVLFIAFVAF